MKKVILAASLIAGVIAISACTKVNPITEAINNNAQIELAPNGGGHGHGGHGGGC